MAKLFDTHSHYTDEKLFGNEELLSEIFAGDVGHIITVAVDVNDSAKCAELAAAHENMFCSAGIHPSEIDKVSDIPTEVAKLERFLAEKKCVAIGEIGLDFYWKPYDKETQIKVFLDQIDIANELKLPICVHMRDATQDTLELLKEINKD